MIYFFNLTIDYILHFGDLRRQTISLSSLVSFDIFNKLLVVVKVKAELRSLLPGQSWPEGEC